jgi:hypothetical protein
VVAVRKLSAFAFLALAVAALTLPTLAPPARAQPYRVYLICVGEAGDSWINKEAFASFLSSNLKSIGISHEVVRKIDDWEKLVDQAPENAVVVNCHGEVMPIPTKYGDNFTAFYLHLARNVREKGWVLVFPIGLTTWLIGNEKTVGYTNVVDGPSFSAFISAMELPPSDPWCGQSAQISDLGKRVAAVLGLSANVPDTVSTPRALAVNGSSPLWYFYKVPESAKTWGGAPYYSMAAWKVGKGLVVWGGLSSGEEVRKAAITAAAVAYILDPTVAQRTPPPPPLITPQQAYAYAIIGMTAAVIAVLALVIVRGRAPKTQAG